MINGQELIHNGNVIYIFCCFHPMNFLNDDFKMKAIMGCSLFIEKKILFQVNKICDGIVLYVFGDNVYLVANVRIKDNNGFLVLRALQESRMF